MVRKGRALFAQPALPRTKQLVLLILFRLLQVKRKAGPGSNLSKLEKKHATQHGRFWPVGAAASGIVNKHNGIQISKLLLNNTGIRLLI